MSNSMVPIVGNWIPTLANSGVPENVDPYNGSGWGSFIATSSINPINWTRSYSRSAYIDPLPERSNPIIMPNVTVSRILFASHNVSGGLAATSVQFTPYKGADVQTVNVRREVILSAGSIGSPQILMLSGVGPEPILQNAGVNVVLNLPGVGQHLQDHIVTEIVWSTDQPTAGSLEEANSNGSPPTDATSTEFLSFVNSATSYVNSTVLFGNSEAAVITFQTQIATQLNSSMTSLCPSVDPTVQAGYAAIYQLGYESFLTSSVGQVEILLAVNEAGQIAIQAALQHPFSQGHLYITSDDPFTPPTIDPQYLSHSADTTLLRQGLKLARSIGNTFPISSVVNVELSPGSSVQTDDEWEEWLVNQIQTEYHPSCSCAMLPLSLGGVVDSQLKVYGLSNVRVADASVFPIQFAAHLQAPTYGLAEQAAKIIRAQWNGEALIPVVPNGPNSVNHTDGDGDDSGNSSGDTKTSMAVSFALGRSAVFSLLWVSSLAILLGGRNRKQTTSVSDIRKFRS